MQVTQRGHLMKLVEEKEQECWRENLIEMAEPRNVPLPRGLHSLKVEGL